MMSVKSRLLRLVLTPWTAAVAFTLCSAFLYMLERAIAHMPFVMLSTLAISCGLFLVSRRFYFSLYAGLAAAVLIAITSVIKYRTKGFDLHVYDVVFTGTDAKAFRFLLDAYAALIIPVLILLVCAITSLVVIFIAETKTKAPATSRTAMLAVCFALIPLSYPLRADEPRYFHYLGGFNASAFFISFLDLRDAAFGHGIAERLSAFRDAEPFEAVPACTPQGPRPDLFLVLSESHYDLSRIKEFGIGEQFSRQFKSRNGESHALRVETFGGGTWISNFSLLTGLSSLDFGWQAPYLTTAMQGKVHESLATSLARCGYRTAVLTPMEHGFVNEGPFLQSIGIDEVLDYNRIGAQEYAHRDRFYFEAARNFIAEHRRSDGRPLFLEIQTMFAHSPYSVKLAAVAPVQDIETGDDDLDEYVRRVAQSQQDFAWFLSETARESRSHPSVVLEFGDHQSFATKTVLARHSEDFALDKLSSDAYRTYFTVHPFGFTAAMKPFDYPSLDIGYLGMSLFEAAGLPMPPMFVDLSLLRDRCAGRLHFCEDRAAVDRHLKRRIASGYLTLE